MNFNIETGFSDNLYERLEKIARVCYKSEGKMSGDSEAFVMGLVMAGHHSVLEHETATVYIKCNRGVSHELVRHRIASYTQKSTRYAPGIAFIRPPWAVGIDGEIWENTVGVIETNYNRLLQRGRLKEEARDLLPNCLETEIYITANLREWRHIFGLRASDKAHYDIRGLFQDIQAEFISRWGRVFE